MASWVNTVLFHICMLTVSFTCGLERNEGRDFAVAFPYMAWSGLDTDSELLITAQQESAQVNIHGEGLNENINVPAGSTYVYLVNSTWYVRSEAGTERKVIYVTSNELITIMYSRRVLESRVTPDATTCRPMSQQNGMYLLSGAPATLYSVCTSGTGSHGGYYMVAAYDDNTAVQVYISRNGQFELDISTTLNKYEVYSHTEGEMDIFGYVTSDKPISVYSGNACHQLKPEFQSEASSQYTHESMPIIWQLASEYIALPVANGPSNAGYVLRIVAAEDDTDVLLPDVSGQPVATLNAAQHYDFDGENIWDTDKSLVVRCSKACMVVQFSKDIKNEAEPSEECAMFMIVLTPVELSSNDIKFQPPSLIEHEDYSSTLVVIVQSYPPPGDLYLNGNNIRNEAWESVGGGSFSSLFLDLQSGFQTLFTDDISMIFTAYMYSIKPEGMAVGLNLGFGINRLEIGTTTPTSTTTTTPGDGSTTSRPEPYPGTPGYTITLLGDFHSLGGEEFTLQCISLYSNSLSSSANSMLFHLNQILGTPELCSTTSEGDIVVASTSSNFFADGNTGNTIITFFVRLVDSQTFGGVEVCMQEMAQYVEDFDNWDQPIIPQEDDCPEVRFNPEKFDSEHSWDCDDASLIYFPSVDQHMEATTALRYRIDIHDLFDVLDDPLDLGCSNEYSDTWHTELSVKSNELNSLMTERALCADADGQASILTVNSNFAASGLEGYMQGSFHLVFADTVLMRAIVDCGSEIFEAVSLHENWRNDPILPQPPECPALDHADQQFVLQDLVWICLLE